MERLNNISMKFPWEILSFACVSFFFFCERIEKNYEGILETIEINQSWAFNAQKLWSLHVLLWKFYNLESKAFFPFNIE